ncbi:lysozyme g-like [Halichoeres trimaculatus]|uniref:lysozyme g-like n=1 Tax=Halichoeres trimaculatus TaxID=147232 RepID=UPI003D9E4181
MKVETSGASSETAAQDGPESTGVIASYKMARMDAKRMEKYRDIINEVAEETEIHPALIAGIISRESRAGNTIRKTKGWGDYSQKRKAYNAFGLMQVDVDPNGGNHKPKGEWDSKEHLLQATEILVRFIKIMQKKFKGCSMEEKLKGGIAAYNIGDGKVESYDEVDDETTGGDYSNDVVARAQWYEKNCGY